MPILAGTAVPLVMPGMMSTSMPASRNAGISSPAAPEQKRVATLEPGDMLPLLRQRDHHAVDECCGVDLHPPRLPTSNTRAWGAWRRTS